MIGYWHHPVVRLSVCNAVHCGSQGRSTGLKVNCTSVFLAGNFPFVPSNDFAI